MGFFDSIGRVIDIASDIGGLVSTGYNIYSGINNMNTANEYYDTLAGTAEMQDKIASDTWKIQKPLMTKQGTLSGLELDAAIAKTPGLLSKQYDLADRGLTEQGLDMDLYGSTRGILNKFFDESENGINPGLEMNRAGATVESAMSGAQGQLSRSLGRRGIQLGEDQSTTLVNQQLINKALGKAAARNEAYRAAKDTNYNRLGNAANVRAGMSAKVAAPQTPQINIGNASSAASSSAATSSSIAQAASQAANAAFTEAGYGLSRQY